MDSRAEEFKTLTLLLSNGDESLSEDVALSEKNPDAYVKVHAEELKNRGIHEPIDGLPWIALIDGLEKNGKLIELDWKESSKEFVEAILKLSAKEESAAQIRDSLTSIQIEDSAKVSENLERINEALKPFDYNVIMIDIRADCYPLTLIPFTSKASVTELADLIETERIYGF